MAEETSEKPVTPERITQMAWGFAPPLMLQAGVENHVFDVLDAGPKTMEEIVAATKASKRGIKALVEGLAGLGLLVRTENTFSLAPDTAAFLVAAKPGFLGGVLGHLTGQLLETWMRLPKAVRTGKPVTAVNQQKPGAKFFRKFVEDLFNLNYAGASALAENLAPALSSNEAVKILDLAAGSGVWGIAMAQKIPQAHITAVDWEKVTPITRKIAKRHQLEDRLTTIEGDLQKADFGKGYNIALLGHILHSEGESRSRKLLKKVFKSLAPGGTIAIAEFVPDEGRAGPAYPLIFAVNMLVHTDVGDTYTFSQMTGWLTEAGFENARQIAVPGPSPILVATKPG
jgi:ubiquinone/menaquinone biosynthesis C-methylase UbiE